MSRGIRIDAEIKETKTALLEHVHSISCKTASTHITNFQTTKKCSDVIINYKFIAKQWYYKKPHFETPANWWVKQLPILQYEQ